MHSVRRAHGIRTWNFGRLPLYVKLPELLLRVHCFKNGLHTSRNREMALDIAQDFILLISHAGLANQNSDGLSGKERAFITNKSFCLNHTIITAGFVQVGHVDNSFGSKEASVIVSYPMFAKARAG